VKFAIRNVIEHPPVGAQVLRRLWQPDPHCGITLRNDYVPLNLALWRLDLGSEGSTTKDCNDNLFEQTSPLIGTCS
jgi:hypothetical protein